MNRIIPLLLLSLLALRADASPAVYYCNILTQLPGAPDSPVFRFAVDGATAILTYSYRARPTEPPQHFELALDVLNDSQRSLVLGRLTEGNDERAPRYDVWVLDKNNMYLHSEVTHASDKHIGRLEQRSGTCVYADAELAPEPGVNPP